jgi:hypothetical protein
MLGDIEEHQDRIDTPRAPHARSGDLAEHEWIAHLTATGIVLTVTASVRLARREGLLASVSSDGTLCARACDVSGALALGA